MRHRPSAHPEAFAIVMSLSAALYFNFAWFREQFCAVLCPYGRLQSVLLDSDSLVGQLVFVARSRAVPTGACCHGADVAAHAAPP